MSTNILIKRPKAYLEILEAIKRAMETFSTRLPEKRNDVGMRKLHASLLARMEFYKAKLQGIESYAYTTLQRLEIQRSAVSQSIFRMLLEILNLLDVVGDLN